MSPSRAPRTSNLMRREEEQIAIREFYHSEIEQGGQALSNLWFLSSQQVYIKSMLYDAAKSKDQIKQNIIIPLVQDIKEANSRHITRLYSTQKGDIYLQTYGQATTASRPLTTGISFIAIRPVLCGSQHSRCPSIKNSSGQHAAQFQPQSSA
jgi:hypothetical protein